MDTIVEAFTLWGKYGPILGVGILVFYIAIGVKERIQLAKYERDKTNEEDKGGFHHTDVHN